MPGARGRAAAGRALRQPDPPVRRCTDRRGRRGTRRPVPSIMTAATVSTHRLPVLKPTTELDARSRWSRAAGHGPPGADAQLAGQYIAQGLRRGHRPAHGPPERRCDLRRLRPAKTHSAARGSDRVQDGGGDGATTIRVTKNGNSRSPVPSGEYPRQAFTYTPARDRSIWDARLRSAPARRCKSGARDRRYQVSARCRAAAPRLSS
jgi:hypothetical protein